MKKSAHFAARRAQIGFTLIELLVALTIIAILAVSVFVALDPAKRLKDAKDARRATDVDTILTAIHQSIVDSKGTLPTNLQALAVDTMVQLGTSATGCTVSTDPDCTIAAVACTDLITGTQNLAKYLKTMPFDPDTTLGSETKTGYAVERDTNGIVTVTACYTDGTTTISASR